MGTEETLDMATFDQRARAIVEQYHLAHEAGAGQFHLQEPSSDLPEDVRFALHMLIATCDQSTLSAPAQAGGIIGRIRQKLHRLVVYYVNQSATRQIAFNVAAVHAINTLADQLRQSEAEVADLRRQLRQAHAGDK